MVAACNSDGFRALSERLGLGELHLIGELLGLLSHDLRNPLAALHSNLGYLGSVLGSGQSEAGEAVADGLVSCDGLSHVIDNVDLLGLALRGDHRSGGPSPVGAVVAAAVERCRLAAGSHGLLLELAEGSQRVHGLIDGSRDILMKAVANLIRNSIQHAPAASTVRVSLQVQSGSAEITVEDRGVPIPEVLRDVALSAAGQVEGKSRSNCRYSRGLGLFCANVATTLCGGRIDVGGGDGVEGHRFRVRFPLLPV